MQKMSGMGFSVIQYFEFDEKEHLIDYIWSIRYMDVMSHLRECT
jgi:hypothetical protein